MFICVPRDSLRAPRRTAGKQNEKPTDTIWAHQSAATNASKAEGEEGPCVGNVFACAGFIASRGRSRARSWRFQVSAAPGSSGVEKRITMGPMS